MYAERLLRDITAEQAEAMSALHLARARQQISASIRTSGKAISVRNSGAHKRSSASVVLGEYVEFISFHGSDGIVIDLFQQVLNGAADGEVARAARALVHASIDCAAGLNADALDSGEAPAVCYVMGTGAALRNR